MQGQGKK